MHGISYASLMLIIDALPTPGKGEGKRDDRPLSINDVRNMGVNYMNEG